MCKVDTVTNRYSREAPKRARTFSKDNYALNRMPTIYGAKDEFQRLLLQDYQDVRSVRRTNEAFPSVQYEWTVLVSPARNAGIKITRD